MRCCTLVFKVGTMSRTERMFGLYVIRTKVVLKFSESEFLDFRSIIFKFLEASNHYRQLNVLKFNVLNNLLNT